ncbi:AmmeMemoRadiSam system radical SAM enzyme [Candidatus Woesearchaeota archaeon]|nr:AmmeMemoRadiSam system radical SAM enzyme [Candidatus Woesearchaeota archaeon]
MKEAMHYKKLKGEVVQCQLCPQFCILKDKAIGKCRARKNVEGKLYSLVYGFPCTASIDPIEKKPLFHFLPGSKAFSIGSTGCNMICIFCQNWKISQADFEEVAHRSFSPKEVVCEAVDAGCESIAYTYAEPTIFYEYVLETAKLARKNGLRNVMVTNGFVNPEPLKELYKHIDAANVDLKGFSEEYYQKICGARLKPVLESIKLLKKMGVWFEITNLVIPKLNDSESMIRAMCIWIKKELGDNYPLHLSRFFPMYKLTNIAATPPKTLMRAYEIAKEVGLKHVYIGNLGVGKEENTYCSKCGKALIKRRGFEILENTIKDGKCSCNEKIAGVWK